MRRRPPRVLAAASAVLLAGVVAVWLLSFGRSVGVVHGDPGIYDAGAFVDGGLVRLWRRSRERPAPWFNRWTGFVESRDDPGLARAQWTTAPGRWSCGPVRYWTDGARRSVDVAMWFPASLLAVAPAWSVLARRRRPPPGHCRLCGYDLTANASGRCPECGAEAPAGIT